MLRLIKFLCIIFVLIAPEVNAQVPVSLENGQERLVRLFNSAAASKSNAEKEKVHDSIVIVLDELLQNPESFDFPFQYVRNLGKVYSDDGRIRFYTWNLPYSDGTNRYYGIIQYKPENNSKPVIFRLTDRSDEITSPESEVSSAGNWYGCLVYEVVVYRNDKKDLYLILGYDPHDRFISRRLIDILYFDENQQPVFGTPVFQRNNKLQTRVFFEYSAKAQMNLHWIQDMKMIVFDHLSPEKASYTGNYRFYGPDFTYDGFILEDGIWILQENIDVRNIPD